jgi:drug/metabolite transporter (DMT)-like permease
LDKRYAPKRKIIPFFIVYGLIGALLQLSQYGGILLGIPVAIVTLLIYTQPIWSLIFGKLASKERITKIKIISLIIAVVGVAILIEPWEAEFIANIVGISSALMAGIFLSLFIIYTKKSRIRKQHYITTTFGYFFFSVLWLILFIIISLFFIQIPKFNAINFNNLTNYWYYILFLGLIAFLIPHTLFSKAIKNIEASKAAIIVLVEPVSAAVYAFILFAQPLTTNIIIGGILIIISNYLIIKMSK